MAPTSNTGCTQGDDESRRQSETTPLRENSLLDLIVNSAARQNSRNENSGSEPIVSLEQFDFHGHNAPPVDQDRNSTFDNVLRRSRRDTHPLLPTYRHTNTLTSHSSRSSPSRTSELPSTFDEHDDTSGSFLFLNGTAAESRAALTAILQEAFQIVTEVEEGMEENKSTDAVDE